MFYKEDNKVKKEEKEVKEEVKEKENDFIELPIGWVDNLDSPVKNINEGGQEFEVRILLARVFIFSD